MNAPVGDWPQGAARTPDVATPLEGEGERELTATADRPADPGGALPPARSAGRARRRRALAGGAVLLVAIVVAVVVLTQSRSPTHNAAGTGVPAGDTTATVTRRTLAESSTVDGTLGYGSTLELYDRLSGTFTWLPGVGAVIARGGTLFRVNNLPVALMYGSVPAYRTLKEGISDGPDVVELNENLIDLGFDPYGAITDDDAFGEATAAAVRRWQKAEGLLETGEVRTRPRHLRPGRAASYGREGRARPGPAGRDGRGGSTRNETEPGPTGKETWLDGKGRQRKSRQRKGGERKRVQGKSRQRISRQRSRERTFRQRTR